MSGKRDLPIKKYTEIHFFKYFSVYQVVYKWNKRGKESAGFLSPVPSPSIINNSVWIKLWMHFFLRDRRYIWVSWQVDSLVINIDITVRCTDFSPLTLAFQHDNEVVTLAFWRHCIEILLSLQYLFALYRTTFSLIWPIGLSLLTMKYSSKLEF